MKSIRKVSAILFTAMILVSVLAGCGKEENTGKTTVAAENTSTTTDITTQKAEETTTALETSTSPFTAKVGESVILGSYEQDNNTVNGKESVAWRVLAIETGKALLISEKILDARAYNEDAKDLTWETCSLRTWLNNDFFNNAFTSAEKLTIVQSKSINSNNPEYATPGGNETQDKVFLLSLDEAKLYFANDKAREAQGTDFAKNNGLWVSGTPSSGNSRWWLRTPGIYPDMACFVESDGTLTTYGNGIDIKDTGIRPAIWIYINSK